MSQGFVNPKPSPLPVNQGGTGVLTSTGTVAVVLSTSPTLVTPTIGAATATSIKISNTGIIDTNGKVALALGATTNAVNAFTITNSIATASPSFSATGTDTNITMTLNGKGTGGVATKGTSTNDSAAAGYVGEFVSSIVTSGAPISLTTLVTSNITSISLTAGEWDVWGIIGVGGTSTANAFLGSISTSSATIVSTFADNTSFAAFSPTLNPGTYASSTFPLASARISISTTTTVYLSVQLTFTGSGTAFGAIRARRVR